MRPFYASNENSDSRALDVNTIKAHVYISKKKQFIMYSPTVDRTVPKIPGKGLIESNTTLREG